MLIYIQAIQNESDRSLVEELYSKYSSTMLYIAQSILKDRYRAEDAVTQAFVKIIDNLQKFYFEDCNKTKGLVVIIVRNVCYDMIKSEKREKIMPLEDFENIAENEADTPLNFAVSVESYDFVINCLSCLSDRFKDILRLKLVYEYTYHEISQTLEITPDNARVRFHRARKALIEEMRKRGDSNE